MSYQERKNIRKIAAHMALVRAMPSTVKLGWRIAILIEEYGMPHAVAHRMTGKSFNRSSMAYKQFKKFQDFARKGVHPSEISRATTAWAR